MATALDVKVISIGTLAANPLWGERQPVRTGHATTTLITRGETRLLVDPGLPATVLAARLAERANLTPADITHVFLTSFHPDTRRGLAAFEEAEWLIHEAEREGVGIPMAARLKQLGEGARGRGKGSPTGPGSEDDDEMRQAILQDVALLQRCKAADDEIVEGVSLFPLPGVTPGMCGLLIEEARHTTLICGDAIPTLEHLEQGKVLPTAVSVDQARKSFEEAVEIADLIVPGRDNIVVSPTKRAF